MCSILCYCSADVDIPALQEALSETSSRGPDDSRIVNTGEGWIGFNRLSIMGITGDGMQPFVFRNRTSCRVSELTDTPEGYRIPPDTTPIASEEYTSLVISARPIAMIGGSSAMGVL